MKVTAPWSEDIVERLKRWQLCGFYHEYRCGKCKSVLKATQNGWVCTSGECGYKQDWAHEPPTIAEFDQHRSQLKGAGFTVP